MTQLTTEQTVNKQLVTRANNLALAGHHPAKQKVADSVSGQGTCLGWGPGPQLGHVRGNPSLFLSHIKVSLPLSPSL